MGIFDKSSDSTTTQSTAYPSWITDAQKGLATAAAGIATPFMGAQQYSLAGQNADQQQAAALARQSTLGAFNTNGYNDIMGAGKGYNANTAGSTDYTASQITPDQIAAGMNPYLKSVGQDTINSLRQQNTADNAAIGARAASGAAFGGSGPALERAQLQRNFGQNVGNTMDSLLSNGYSAATQLAGTNTAANNQASASNAAADNAVSMANANSMNQAGATNSGLALSAANNATAANHQQFTDEQTALQSLLGIGNQNQAYAQQAIDIPKSNISWLAGLLPPVAGTTSSTTPQYTNPLSTLLGGANLASTLGFL